MSKQHQVRQGECISSIAFDHGFAPSTLWDHESNADLRELRGDPFVLLPGDVVFIPDQRQTTTTVETGKLHRFVRRAVPERLKLRLLRYGTPRKNLAYVLEVDGVALDGQTDGDGQINHPIPPNARRAVLILGEDERHELLLGHVDPVSEESGVEARLRNLGYLAPGAAGEEALRDAVEAFQAANELEPTGDVDDDLRDTLAFVHGS